MSKRDKLYTCTDFNNSTRVPIWKIFLNLYLRHGHFNTVQKYKPILIYQSEESPGHREHQRHRQSLTTKVKIKRGPTIGLESEIRSFSVSRKPWSSTSWALMSCSLATHTAAVLRTYGSSSFRHLRSGSQRYSVILSTRMQPIVRTARALISGLGSSQSWEWGFGGT